MNSETLAILDAIKLTIDKKSNSTQLTNKTMKNFRLRHGITRHRFLPVMFLVITIILTAYVSIAYEAMSFIKEINGSLHWRLVDGGTLFPFPSVSLENIRYHNIAPLSPVDAFIYQFLLNTGILRLITMFLWLIQVLYAIKNLFFLDLARNL